LEFTTARPILRQLRAWITRIQCRLLDIGWTIGAHPPPQWGGNKNFVHPPPLGEIAHTFLFPPHGLVKYVIFMIFLKKTFIPPHGGGGTEIFWGCSPPMVEGEQSFFGAVPPPWWGGPQAIFWTHFFVTCSPPTVEGEQPQNGKMTSFLGENPPKSRFLGQNRENTSFFGQNFGFGPPHSWGGQVVFLSPPKTRLAPPTVEGEQNSRGG